MPSALLSETEDAAPHIQLAPPKLYGCEVPRIFTPPLRELTPETSHGFEAIEFAEDILGLTLFPWQKWVLIHALELLEDGTYRFQTVVLLVARQNGKSTLMSILTLWRMFVDGAQLVLGAAQSLDIAEEQWAHTVELAQANEELSALVANVVQKNGAKALELTGGERYKVAAATRRGGRGLSTQLVLLDELREHKTFDAWSAMSKTTQAQDYGQVWAASNAGDAESVVLAHLRKVAHAAIGDPDGINRDPITGLSTIPEAILDEDGEPIEEDDAGLGIFEYSAAPNLPIWDKQGWTQANPSLGWKIRERKIAADAKTDPEWTFRTEVLCQWYSGAMSSVFPVGAWEQGKDEESKIRKKSPRWLCVDLSENRQMTSIAVAGYRKDGTPHVEVIQRRAGNDWVIPYLTDPERRKRFEGVVFQSTGAPISSMSTEFENSGLNIVKWEGSDLAKATGILFDAVKRVVPIEGETVLDNPTPGVYHRSAPVLDVAANAAKVKRAGDAWVWDRIKSAPVDIAPLIACTGALWALTTQKKRPTSIWDDDSYEPLYIG